MQASTTDRIEKSTVLRAPRSRVWRALTDPEEFSHWFGVKVEGPFRPGARIRGSITHPGWEHVPFEISIERMEPERLFSWRWPHRDQSGSAPPGEPTTLVVFELEEIPEGTRLTVIESGFDGIPAPWREKAYRGNESGWIEQLQNIKRHVESTA